jgi:hypothetical protein
MHDRLLVLVNCGQVFHNICNQKQALWDRLFPAASVIPHALSHSQEIGMEVPCFIEKGSNPPACGVHRVPLEERQTSGEHLPGGVGYFAFLVCPVSGQVPRDAATQS